MQSYGIEINKENYKNKSIRELENALDTCKAVTEDGLFSRTPTLADLLRADEASRLAPLIEAELERRKRS